MPLSAVPVTSLWPLHFVPVLLYGRHFSCPPSLTPATSLTQALGPALERHDRYRRNELGIQIFNGGMWPEKHYRTIALGDDNLDHARMRPVLDAMVGPAVASSAATKQLIGEATDALLAGGVLPTGSMVTQWGTKLLHKRHP